MPNPARAKPRTTTEINRRTSVTRNAVPASIAVTVNQVLNFQSSYYYIGHFSKFISRGAKRIIAAATKDELETTAFVNPDGKIVTVVLNRSEKEIKFCLKFRDEAVNVTSLPRSIITVEIE